MNSVAVIQHHNQGNYRGKNVHSIQFQRDKSLLWEESIASNKYQAHRLAAESSHLRPQTESRKSTLEMAYCF